MYNTLYSYPILMKVQYFDSFSKKTEIYFTKIRLVGAELCYAGRRTDAQTSRS